MKLFKESTRAIIWRAFIDHLSRWIFGFLSLVLVSIFFYMCNDTPQAHSDVPPPLPLIINNGLVKERYYTYSGSYTYPYKGGGEKEADSLRNESVKRLIDEKIIKGSDSDLKWFRKDNIDSLLKDVRNIYGALLLKSNPANAYFVLSGDHEDSYNEEKHLYTYTPVVLVPKERYMRYPKDIGGPLNKYLDGLYVKEIRELNNKETVEIVLMGVKLEKGKFQLSDSDNDEIVKILKFSPDKISKFIRDMINGHNSVVIDNFPSGEYEMEEDMEAVLTAFVKNFMNERPKGYKYDIYCYGYADEKPINSMVAYYGEADFSKGIDQSVLLENLHEPKQAYNIKDNNELSIARACAGARIIKQYILTEDSGNVNNQINIYYAGQGVMNTNNYDYARQIKIIVKKK
jgi:hypothetical protein